MALNDILLFSTLFALTFCILFIWKQRRDLNTAQQKEHQFVVEKSLLEQQIAFQDKTLNNQSELIGKLEIKIKESFQSITQDTLLKNHASMMEVAKASFEKAHETSKHDLDQRHSAIKNLVDPMKLALSQVDEKLKGLEKERTVAYIDLKAQVKSLIETQKDLKDETSSLVKALRNPSTRGQWGEFQLKRVVELAGMVERCDFVQQETSNNLRPDMIVRLPGDKQIVVDAKTPLFGYLNALDAKTDIDKKKFMAEHAMQVKTHIKQLSQKSYWEQFKNTPEFVVMFIPSESLFSAALEQDPTLIEFGANERVILATPTTLIALLRSVAYGWRQESVHESVQDVINLGQELYKRFNTVSQYFSKIGRHLNQSVDSYNQTLASFENRLIPVMRRFQDIKALKTDTIPEPFKPIDAHSKSPQSMEFLQNEE